MITLFSLGQEDAISALIRVVFDEFVGFEYTEEGNRIFYDFIKPESIVERYKAGNIILTYQADNKIVGMIEVRDNNHICLFFVDKNHHNQGIGTALFNEAAKKVKAKTSFIEVNASPFSEPIYAKLGFNRTGNKTEINGIQFIPMRMKMQI